MDVVEVQYAVLQSEAAAARDFEELRRSLHEFLAKIAGQCFQNAAPVWNHIENFYV
jgi:hypothetical protein